MVERIKKGRWPLLVLSLILLTTIFPPKISKSQSPSLLSIELQLIHGRVDSLSKVYSTVDKSVDRKTQILIEQTKVLRTQANRKPPSPRKPIKDTVVIRKGWNPFNLFSKKPKGK